MNPELSSKIVLFRTTFFTPFQIFYNEKNGILRVCIGPRGTIFFKLRDVMDCLGISKIGKAFDFAAEDIFPSDALFGKDWGWLISFDGIRKIESKNLTDKNHRFRKWIEQKVIPNIKPINEIPKMDREIFIPDFFRFWCQVTSQLIIAWATWGLLLSLLELFI